MSDFSPKRVYILLDSGETAKVSPLSFYAQQDILARLNEQYPLPDPEAYKLPNPEEDPIPGMEFLPANENPAYVEAGIAANKQRLKGFREALIDLCVEFEASREDMISRHARAIARLRKYADIPQDEWYATLYYAVLTSAIEIQMLVNAAQQQLPLTEGETLEGVRIFRPALQGSAAGGNLSELGSPAAQRVLAHQTQRPAQ